MLADLWFLMVRLNAMTRNVPRARLYGYPPARRRNSYRYLYLTPTSWTLVSPARAAIGPHAGDRTRPASHFVESRMGASTDALSAAPFPIPAHQTGRAQLRHPAFRLASSQTHERVFTLARLSRNTPNSPNTASMLKRLVPRECTW